MGLQLVKLGLMFRKDDAIMIDCRVDDDKRGLINDNILDLNLSVNYLSVFM